MGSGPLPYCSEGGGLAGQGVGGTARRLQLGGPGPWQEDCPSPRDSGRLWPRARGGLRLKGGLGDGGAVRAGMSTPRARRRQPCGKLRARKADTQSPPLRSLGLSEVKRRKDPERYGARRLSTRAHASCSTSAFPAIALSRETTLLSRHVGACRRWRLPAEGGVAAQQLRRAR